MKVGFSKVSLSIASTTKYLLENINSASIRTAINYQGCAQQS